MSFVFYQQRKQHLQAWQAGIKPATHSPGLLSVGGERRSLICASLSPSTHWTSRVRRRGQLELQSADTAAQEHPDNFNTRRPERDNGTLETIKRGGSGESLLVDLGSESSVPGNRLMSQLNCFLEMLVQLRSRETGCRRIIPLSMRGVMEVQRLRLIVVQSLLSQHLDNREKDSCHILATVHVFMSPRRPRISLRRGKGNVYKNV